MDTREKKELSSCAVCHHETKPSKGLQTYCYHCKKIEKWARRFLFSAEVADSTGSIDVTLYSEEAETFIGLNSCEYANMESEERSTMLQLSSFQNVLLRVKSEKVVGGSSHYVAKASRVGHKRGLDQIKEKTIQAKTQYTNNW